MSYVDEVLERVIRENPNEPEFHQAVKEVLNSLRPVVDANEEKFRRDALLERLVNPERQLKFRVPWVDDKGQVQVNTGYRVQLSILDVAPHHRRRMDTVSVYPLIKSPPLFCHSLCYAAECARPRFCRAWVIPCNSLTVFVCCPPHSTANGKTVFVQFSWVNNICIGAYCEEVAK